MTRAGIRTKIAELLAALPSFAYTNPAGASEPNVFKARLNQVPRERMPCAQIFFDGEAVEATRKGSGGRTLRRDGVFMVEVVGVGDDEEALEAALDTLSGAVEAALTADNDLAGAVREIHLSNVQYDADDGGEGEECTGTALMSFPVWYETTEGA